MLQVQSSNDGVNLYQRCVIRAKPVIFGATVCTAIRVTARASIGTAVVAVFCASAFLSNVSAAQSKETFDSHEPIPHSTVATADGKGIVKAMLSCETDRYAHGVLGDSIEAGCLVVEDELGNVHVLSLPTHQVFEDLIPRIADINDDTRNDVVLVRSDSSEGAALSVYTLAETAGELAIEELVATPPIGRANRWLAPVGIADFNNDGALDIAYVQTPHIGGILKVWSMVDNEFQQIAQARGFSNHGIGSTRVSTAKIADFNNDGVVDIALPDQSRQNTVTVSLHPEPSILDTKPYDIKHFD